MLANWIAGEAATARSGESLDDVNPATGEVIDQIPRSGTADVDAAVSAAQAALDGEWGSLGTQARADLLEAIAKRLEANADAFARAESLDSGKPITLARNVDIPRAVANFRFFAGAVRHSEAGLHAMDDIGALNYTLRRRVGVCALITPWNLPLYLLSWKVAPALAMGNAVVAKPSEMTPATASMLGELSAEAGLPPGVLNIVHGLGPEAGQALIEHKDVAGVSFTGGTATGRKVAASVAPRFAKLSLELGGKNPSVVFADCDFDKTVDGVLRAGFQNTGQICLCGSRVLIERSIYDRFVEALVARARQMRVGDPANPETQMGSLISRAHRDKVERYIALGQEEGGRILAGGGRPSLPAPLDAERGAFVEPTIIGGLDPGCRTATEEIFGPVITVHPFDDEAEALRMANGVRYGLAASVWTRDLSRAHRVAAAIESGMVWVNSWLLRDLRVPFGGLKDSGVGREGGRWSLEFFSESRNICIQL